MWPTSWTQVPTSDAEERSPGRGASSPPGAALASRLDPSNLTASLSPLPSVFGAGREGMWRAVSGDSVVSAVSIDSEGEPSAAADSARGSSAGDGGSGGSGAGAAAGGGGESSGGGGESPPPTTGEDDSVERVSRISGLSPHMVSRIRTVVRSQMEDEVRRIRDEVVPGAAGAAGQTEGGGDGAADALLPERGARGHSEWRTARCRSNGRQ